MEVTTRSRLLASALAVLAVMTALLLAFPPAAHAEELTAQGLSRTYVFDEGNVLTDDMTKKLDNTASSLSSKYGFGVYFLTTDFMKGMPNKSSGKVTSYANSYYKDHKLGLNRGSNAYGDGVLLVLETSTGYFKTVTFGKGSTLITASAVERMEENVSKTLTSYGKTQDGWRQMCEEYHYCIRDYMQHYDNYGSAFELIGIHRLYNPNSGEHFYTSSTKEKDNLVSVGWQYEGIGWNGVDKSDTPVYRLYNKYGGEHHYTMNKSERDMLAKAGWKDEGVGFYTSNSRPRGAVMREYNPNAFANNHNYTRNMDEHKYLISIGWKNEGQAWFDC